MFPHIFEGVIDIFSTPYGKVLQTVQMLIILQSYEIN